MTVATASNAASKSSSAELYREATDLLKTEIDFISNPEFAADLEEEISASQTLSEFDESSTAPADLPAHLRRMCESELLTKEQEASLFRDMNFAKFKANALRTELNPESATRQQLDAIQSLLHDSRLIRDHIIQSNMRLVISIVKKFVTPQQSFDEMLSDGIVTLMHAVEKFDYDRGFRFSTYAYRSIARNAYRMVTAAQKEESKFTRDAEDWAFELEDDRGSSSMNDQVWGNLRSMMTSMLDKLDRRERFIIRSRYALGAHRKVRTFQCLADKLGVSKERVRQLEQRAVNKMKNMAAESNLDDLMAASMV